MELVALVAWLILVIVLVVNRPDNLRMRMVNNDIAKATISDLQRALEVYASDFNTYPVCAFVADTTFFIRCLRAKGPRGASYFNFRDEDIVNGEFRSYFDKPYRYMYPAKGLPGPDGKVHKGKEYYLWTWGYSNPDEPPSEWGVNNWSQ